MPLLLTLVKEEKQVNDDFNVFVLTGPYGMYCAVFRDGRSSRILKRVEGHLVSQHLEKHMGMFKGAVFATGSLSWLMNCLVFSLPSVGIICSQNTQTIGS